MPNLPSQHPLSSRLGLVALRELALPPPLKTKSVASLATESPFPSSLIFLSLLPQRVQRLAMSLPVGVSFCCLCGVCLAMWASCPQMPAHQLQDLLKVFTIGRGHRFSVSGGHRFSVDNFANPQTCSQGGPFQHTRGLPFHRRFCDVRVCLPSTWQQSP